MSANLFRPREAGSSLSEKRVVLVGRFVGGFLGDEEHKGNASRRGKRVRTSEGAEVCVSGSFEDGRNAPLVFLESWEAARQDKWESGFQPVSFLIAECRAVESTLSCDLSSICFWLESTALGFPKVFHSCP